MSEEKSSAMPRHKLQRLVQIDTVFEIGGGDWDLC